MESTKVHTPEFNKLLIGFLQELKKEGKDEIYISQNKHRMMEFFSYVESSGVTSLKTINQSVANDYIRYMEQERLNENFGGTLWQTTINSHKSSIHRFWKYLDAEGIEANTIWLRQKKKTSLKEIVVLTRNEVQQLYSVCDNDGLGYRDKAMIAIYYGCGMRKSEGLRLLITDFDFNKGRIHIRKSKNNRERYVIMSPKIQQQIEDYIYSYRDLYIEELSSHKNPDAFFIGVNGTPITHNTLSSRLRKLWAMVKSNYGNDKLIALHTLRHTLGTHLYMAKMDIEMIALMLGHRSLNVTQVYIHLTNLLQNEQI